MRLGGAETVSYEDRPILIATVFIVWEITTDWQDVDPSLSFDNWTMLMGLETGGAELDRERSILCDDPPGSRALDQ